MKEHPSPPLATVPAAQAAFEGSAGSQGAVPLSPEAWSRNVNSGINASVSMSYRSPGLVITFTVPHVAASQRSSFKVRSQNTRRSAFCQRLTASAPQISTGNCQLRTDNRLTVSRRTCPIRRASGQALSAAEWGRHDAEDGKWEHRNGRRQQARSSIRIPQSGRRVPPAPSNHKSQIINQKSNGVLAAGPILLQTSNFTLQTSQFPCLSRPFPA